MNVLLPGFETEVRLTTEHSQSSYGLPVLTINGLAYGASDITPAGDRVDIMIGDYLLSTHAQPLAAELRIALAEFAGLD